jgi:hypothetical protein
MLSGMANAAEIKIIGSPGPQRARMRWSSRSALVAR